MNGFADFTVADGRGFFRPSRNVTLDGATALIADALAYAREEGLKQLVVDTRNLSGHEPPDTFQRYFAMNRWLEASGGQVQLALVSRPEMMDPDRFAIKVGENRGFITDAFLTEEEAIDWLDGH